jgi:hypothetical protein
MVEVRFAAVDEDMRSHSTFVDSRERMVVVEVPSFAMMKLKIWVAGQ